MDLLRATRRMRGGLTARQLSCRTGEWRLEGLGTSQDEPLPAGGSVTFNITATKVEGFGEAGSDVTFSKTFPITVDGSSQGSVTVSGDVSTNFATGEKFVLETESFNVNIPETQRVNIQVGCLSRNYDTDLEAGGGSYSIQSIDTPSGVSVGDDPQVAVTVACQGGNCERTDFKVVHGGRTVVQRSRFGPLDEGETQTFTDSRSYQSGGQKTVSVSVGDESQTATYTVQGQGGGNGDGNGDDGTGEPPTEQGPAPAIASTNAVAGTGIIDLTYVVVNNGDQTANVTVEGEVGGETKRQSKSVSPGGSAGGSFIFDVSGLREGSQVQHCVRLV